MVDFSESEIQAIENVFERNCMLVLDKTYAQRNSNWHTGGKFLTLKHCECVLVKVLWVNFTLYTISYFPMFYIDYQNYITLHQNKQCDTTEHRMQHDIISNKTKHKIETY